MSSKRAELKEIIQDVIYDLEMGETIEPWEVDDLFVSYSEKVKEISRRATDEKITFGFTYAWDEIDNLKDSEL
jgi:hypothetical protein